MNIVTNDYGMTGSYTVTIKTFEEYSQITKYFSFTLLVTCIKSIVASTTIPDQIYYIGDPLISLSVPTYALTPAGCPLELFYSAV